MKLKKPTSKEMMGSIIQDSLISFLNYMPNPDDVASGTADSYQTYRKMMSDPRIFSLIGKIKTLALTFPMHIAQGAAHDNVYKFISDIIFFKNLYKKQKRILTGLNYGFSVTELVWAFSDGMWIPSNMITRKPERFSFGQDWQLYLQDIGARRLLDQDYKWLVYQHDPDDENPYGTSLLRSVYWPWLFKQAGYDFWLQATEKYSVKSILAIFKGDGDEGTIKQRAMDIAEALLGIQSGSSTAVGNIDKIEQIGMDGTLADFKDLTEACDTQISYGLTGQAIATSTTNGGSLALGEVQADMMYEDCKGIALEIQGVLQKIVNWTVELNFGSSTKAPELTFDVERKASFDQLMQAIDRKIPISRSALYNLLPKPSCEDDMFILNDVPVTLSDSGSIKKNFTFY